MLAGPMRSCECRMQHKSMKNKKSYLPILALPVCTHTIPLTHSLSSKARGVSFFLCFSHTPELKDTKRPN